MEGIEPAIEGTKPQATPRLGLWIKGIYGLGQIANAVKTIVFGIFSLYFYTTVMGLPGTRVGFASAVGLLWDAIIDPVIGTLSDKAKGRLGKRHGFMLVGAAGMGVSFWAYFSPPQGLSSQALFAWLLVTNLLVRTMSSVFSIPYYALGAELSKNYHERTDISGIRGGFALFGTLATAVLSFVLFFPANPQGEDPKLNMEGYRAMGLFCGIIMSMVAAISAFGTLSYRQFSADKFREPLSNRQRPFLSNALLALRNRSFRMLFFSFSIFFLGTVINATLAIHFLTYYVRLTASSALSAFHFAFYLGALLGVGFWLKVSKIIEKRWLYFVGALSTAAVMCGAFVFLGEGHVFGTGNVPPVLIGSGMAGFFASVLWIIPPSMIADIADQDELLNGERREGALFGLFNFGEQIAAGASILVTGILIDHFAGLVPGQALQSAVTINRIGVLYSLLPCVLLVASALLILRYALNQGKVATIQSKLHSASKLRSP